MFIRARPTSRSLCDAAVTALFGLASAWAGAAQLYVAPGGTDSGTCQVMATPCQTIAYALSQAAVSGDTINIAAGTYVEQLSVSKSVTLSGAGAGSTVIAAPATLAINAAIPGSGGDRTAIVFVGGGVSAVMRDLHVQGPGTTSCASLGYGVFVGGGSTLAFRNGRITLVRDLYPPLSGCQNGTGIRFGAAATGQVGRGSVENTTIETFQKNGITVDHLGSDALISGNTINGELPPPGIAQNGIQVSRGATATITGNTVRNEQCGAASCGPSFTQESATAILLYNPGNVTVTGNTLATSDYGLLLANDVASSAVINVTGNTFTSNRYGGVFASGGTLTLTGNTVSGGQFGVVAASYNGDVQPGVINLNGGNLITGATVAGITVFDENTADAVSPLVQGSNNQFVGNAAGATNVPPQGTISLACNWWGSPTGPAAPGNPLGTGNGATANTVFTNWATNNSTFLCNGNPTLNETLQNRAVPTLSPVHLGLLTVLLALVGGVMRRRSAPARPR